MTAPTIVDYLKYANLQMAAEAFLVDSNGVPLIGEEYLQALIRGNTHASKFIETEAIKFVEEWEVIDQCANTNTGFSGTLFRHRFTRELVVSFRSTEFIDDAARDNLATNTQEIKNTGWAWGQIADMEAWYAELNADPALLQGKQFSVTGYSLGGHLATAFNLLRHEDGTQNRIDQVVTFNGAGVGQVKEGSTLSTVLQNFRDLRTNPDQIVAGFTDPALAEIYKTIRDKLALPTGAWTIDQAKAALNAYQLPDWAVHDETKAALNKEKDRISTALNEIDTLMQEAARVGTLKAGGDGADANSTPVRVPDNMIEAQRLDYRMAVQLTALDTSSANLLGGLQRAYTGKALLPGVTNQYDVVGDTSPSSVANSLWHYGTDVRVFIEDQPLYRGGIAYDALSDTLDYGDVKLLVDGYNRKDFGDTHSLVLIIDSLNVQNTLLQLLPEVERSSEETASKLKTIFQVASYLKAENGESKGSASKYFQI
jgi:pimeloyl-ACP methyl ester carboxylesterase